MATKEGKMQNCLKARAFYESAIMCYNGTSITKNTGGSYGRKKENG